MCRRMADIQSVTAEVLRLGIEKRKKKKGQTTGRKYNVRMFREINSFGWYNDTVKNSSIH